MHSLDFSHDPFLTVMSCVVALVAGFTGLSLTRNLSAKSVPQRKGAIALASVALGGGIWSMHFVAMLGLQLPILFYYDAAITLASALLAILIVAAALIVLHFRERTPPVLIAAGSVMGLGILAMHYVGMAGLQLCRAVYSLEGVALSSAAAVALCVLAVWVAYQRRNDRNILIATLVFGMAVVSVNFLAMADTRFVAEPQPGDFGPQMSNEALAIGVILSSFVIFGTCLWVSTFYLDRGSSTAPAGPAPAKPRPVHDVAPAPGVSLQIPCESEGRKVFIAPRDVAFVRADGHYTQVYTEQDRLF
ncbi:MAG: MHYT domain-containing protein [Pseudomonadota bacterium]